MHLHRSITSAIAIAMCTVTSTLRAEDPRVVVVLQGSDHLVADLKYLCVDLAEEPQRWENDVFPNVDIWLFGVEGRDPIRYDQIIGGDDGRRQQVMVPVTNLNNFINNNLIPIGINVVQDPLDKNLYALGGVWVGWMRVKAGYAIFSTELADLPASMRSPRDTHSELWKTGHDFAARLDNRHTTAEQRAAAFAEYRESSHGKVDRLATESPEMFALREANNRATLELRERLFVESLQVTIGATVNQFRDSATATFELIPAAETSLSETVQRQAQQPSRFAGLVPPDDAIFTGRINYAFGEMSRRHFAQFFQGMREPWQQRIDATAGLTDSQKSARREILEVLLEALNDSLKLDRFDGYVEITANSSGTHSALAALCVNQGTGFTRALELLPASDTGYRTELNVDRVGEVAIHKLTVVERYPAALRDFFGTSGEFYVGVGPDAIWLSIGEDAIGALKSGIEAAADATASKADPTIAELDLNLLPVLQLMTRLRVDGDFDLTSTLRHWGLVEPARPPRNPEDPADVDFNEVLRDYEWRGVASEGLVSDYDRLHFEVKRDEVRIQGNATFEIGILKAIGELIADFARRNLG